VRLRPAPTAALLLAAVAVFVPVAPAAARDSDRDGLSNRFERQRSHTKPRKKDTDRDGLKDGAEVRRHKTRPHRKDTDRDGLKDGPEVHRYKTKPRRKDTDRDRLGDGAEVRRYKTNPRKKDTDGDGLSDWAELRRYHTNPRKKDTDGDGVNDGAEVKAGTDPLKPPGGPPGPAPGDPTGFPFPLVPTWTCDLNAASASAVRSAVQSNPGKTVCVQGAIGNLNLAGVRPAAPVRVAPAAGGGSLGTIDLTSAANIIVEGIALRSATIAGNASAPAQNLVFRSCRAGGSPGVRTVVFAAFDIRAYSQDILVSWCDIGWTAQGGGDNGYGVRAVNGNAGPISRVTVEKSRISHVTADAVQLADVSQFTLDRTELAYASHPPGGIDTHSDSIQVMSLAGDANRFTNNWIHHTGYYDESHNPPSSFAAGQWIWHEWGGGGLVENNLIAGNRNYAPAFSGAISNLVLRRNTIVSNGLAFGAGADDIQWSAGSGTGKVFERNIVGGFGGGSGVAFSGNVFIDQGGRGGTDIGPRGVAFDGNSNPTNLPSSHADAGYRKPSGVPW
jgi:hypothetical protein